MSSNIQSNSAAVEKLISSRKSVATAPTQRRQVLSPDEALMYAWSIGTTRAAEQTADNTPVRHEECPPEVYIG